MGKVQRYKGWGVRVVLLRRWVGRKDDGAELQYNQLWFHREDGVVLPFKENLQKQNKTCSFDGKSTMEVRTASWSITCTLSPSCAWRGGQRCLDKTPQPDWRRFLAPRWLLLLHRSLAASPSATGITTMSYIKLYFPLIVKCQEIILKPVW